MLFDEVYVKVEFIVLQKLKVLSIVAIIDLKNYIDQCVSGKSYGKSCIMFLGSVFRKLRSEHHAAEFQASLHIFSALKIKRIVQTVAKVWKFRLV